MRQYMCFCTFLYVFLCPYVCTYHILLLPILVTYWDYKKWRPLFYFSCVWQIAYPSVNLIVAVSSMYLFVCRVPPSVRPSGHAFFLVVMRGLSNCPVCPSVRQSVCPLAWQSFRPFVCLSVCLFDRWCWSKGDATGNWLCPAGINLGLNSTANWPSTIDF